MSPNFNISNNTGKWFSNFLLSLSMLIILIPYGGEGYYKYSNFFITLIQILVISFILILNDYKIKCSKDMIIILYLSLGMLAIQLLTNGYIVTVVGLPFSYADMSEFVRVFQLILPVAAISCLARNIEEKTSLILYMILIISFFHAGLMVLPKLSMVADSLVELYGEGHYYTAGYARYRGFGIIGQPGKAGMFGLICIIIALIHMQLYRKPRVVPILIIIFSFIAIGVSLSRISLVLSIVVFIVLIRSMRWRLFFLGIIFFSIFIFVLKNVELVETLIRGIDIEHGRYATASHRMVLKQWALEFISQRFDTLLLGVGDTKDYISQFKHPYAFDLSLRTPDSSQTVWLVRYGLIGVLIGYLPLLYVSVRISFSKMLLSDKLYISIIPLYIFILSFLDPFYHDAKISIIAAVLYAYLFNFINRKEKIYEVVNCRA